MDYLVTFFHSQFFVKLPFPKCDFSDQTVIVTGGNTGLGLEAARHIARLGASKIILACRTISKGEKAAADITMSEHLTNECVEVWQLDLTDYASVKAFVKRVDSLDRLDAFIQNAGILTTKYQVAEGEKSTMTVNVTSPVLLGLSVLPKLRKSAEEYGGRGRLSFVGSDLQYVAKFKEADTTGSLYDALNNKETADMNDRYRVAKLLLLYCVREIAARSPLRRDSNVMINYLTPGACKSEIFRDDVSRLHRFLIDLVVSIVFRSTEVGSRALVYAVKPDIEEDTHGAFLMDCKIFSNGNNVDSDKGRSMQKKFTEELFAKLERIQPGVTACL